MHAEGIYLIQELYMAKKDIKKTLTESKQQSEKHLDTHNNQAIEKESGFTEETEDQELADESEEISVEEDYLKKITDLQEKYIRLSAEFDNYRKRTLKERSELLKTAGSEVIIKLLPVMDDFERAIVSMEEAKDLEAVKAGVKLIYSKFRDFMNQQGVKEIESENQEFDTDKHEAITKIPAPDESLRGKIVDVVEKGYYLNDRVIRYAKVVIGE